MYRHYWFIVSPSHVGQQQLFLMLRLKQMIPFLSGWTLPVVDVAIHFMVSTTNTTFAGTSVGSLAT